MTRVLLILLLLLGAVVQANAGLPRSQLKDVFADPRPGAALPLDLAFTDDNGRTLTLGQAIGTKPAVLVFADYTCKNLCGPILAFAAGGLAKTGLVPGRDFHLVVVGIDPKDSLAEARAMKSTHVGPDSPLAKATLMLSGNDAAVRAMTTAAGYHFVYDRQNDQFAHPAIAYVVSPQGRISGTLSGLGLDAADLRLALVEAGHGRIGTVADQIRLLCYCFDPATGIYSAAIGRIMLAAGLTTLAAVGCGIALLTLKARRRAQT